IERAANETVYYDDPRWPAVADRDGSGATGPESYSALHFKAMDATAGWIATAADLVRFADATQGRGVAALLQPQTLAL
ncbi:hypothetical protein ACP3WZ_26340, partial [Salmonella enterica]